MDTSTPHYEQATGIIQRIANNIRRVMRGQDAATRLLLAGFASGGHVLLEDVPGTGKTTLAKALAKSIDADFKRVQFTPDLLPSDILGVSIFDQKEQLFRFHQGPIFTHVLLGDEINRASPRTQSALLEAMGENQVSVEGNLKPLHTIFFVMATQNPLEFHGTYPLPEAQLDRFAMRFGLGYVDAEQEVEILSDQTSAHPLESLDPCANVNDALTLRKTAAAIRISPELKRYIVDIVAATRTAPGVRVGASPRASLTMMKCAQALALIDGLEFVTPDLIQEVAGPVIAHRLSLDQQAHYAGESATRVVQLVLEELAVPA